MPNGDQTVVINRIGQWTAIIALFVYVLNIGQWVGAADEKFKDAETVEKTQQSIKSSVTAIKTKQDEIVKDVDEVKQSLKNITEQQVEDGKKLDAILRKLEED